MYQKTEVDRVYDVASHNRQSSTIVWWHSSSHSYTNKCSLTCRDTSLQPWEDTFVMSQPPAKSFPQAAFPFLLTDQACWATHARESRPYRSAADSTRMDGKSLSSSHEEGQPLLLAIWARTTLAHAVPQRRKDMGKCVHDSFCLSALTPDRDQVRNSVPPREEPHSRRLPHPHPHPRAVSRGQRPSLSRLASNKSPPPQSPLWRNGVWGRGGTPV